MRVTSQDAEVAIPDALLSCLRVATGERDLAWAVPPQEIVGGFDTRIFSFELANPAPPFSGALILRLFDSGDDPVRARWEAAVQNAVAGMGYPAPEVLWVQTEANPLGSTFLVMRRLPGRPMLQANTLRRILSEALRLVTRYPALLADYQARLHDLDPQRLLSALDAAGLSESAPAEVGISRRGVTIDAQLSQLEQRISTRALDRLRPGLRWLLMNRPADPPQRVICHGDFHPINVLVMNGALAGVVDWANTTVTDPAFDVANTRVLLGMAPIQLPAAVDAVIAPVRRLVVNRHARAYAKRRLVDDRHVTYFEALRCLVELAWVGERRATGSAERRNPWGSSRSVRKLRLHFEKATGIRVDLAPIS